MAFRVAIALACIVVASGKEAKSCEPEMKALRKQLDEATKELDTLRAAPAKPRLPTLSVLGAAASAGQMAYAAAQKLLDATDVDEKVTTAVSDAYSKATEANYTDYVNTARGHVKGHYDAHLAGHVDAVSKTLQPHLDQYVSPAIDKANVHAAPFMETAKVHYGTAAKTWETQVLPTLQGHIAEAPKHLGKAQAAANTLLDPIFGAFAKVAPTYRDLLPSHPVDRVLLLTIFAFVAFSVTVVSLRVARVAWSLFYGVFKLAWVVFWGLTSRVLGWSFFLGTGFYFCGLCRRRSGAKAKGLQEKADKSSAKTKATVKELVKMLETFKKDKKLTPAAKQLADLAKSGKAMTTPKELSGKTATKEAVKEALSKFKEIDVKAMGL